MTDRAQEFSLLVEIARSTGDQREVESLIAQLSTDRAKSTARAIKEAAGMPSEIPEVVVFRGLAGVPKEGLFKKAS
jgi:hypothetical protein